MTATPRKTSILESPWYWAYVFVTAAIVILLLNQDRIYSRQAQIENKYQGRQRAVRQLSGEATDTPLSTPRETLIQLGPIFGTLGVLFLVTGLAVVRQLRRNSNRQPNARPAGDSAQLECDSSEARRGAESKTTASSIL